MLVRKALLQDASNVYDLVNSLSGDGTLLKRAFAEICETFGILRWRSPMAAFLSAAARCIFTVRTVRGSFDCGEAGGEGAGCRGKILNALGGRGRGTRDSVCVPVYAHSGLLF